MQLLHRLYCRVRPLWPCGRQTNLSYSTRHSCGVARMNAITPTTLFPIFFLHFASFYTFKQASKPLSNFYPWLYYNKQLQLLRTAYTPLRYSIYHYTILLHSSIHTFHKKFRTNDKRNYRTNYRTNKQTKQAPALFYHFHNRYTSLQTKQTKPNH